MLKVSGLYIYPIKSLGGIALNEAFVTDTGFQFDRKWMLVDENYRFLSQRTERSMALLQTKITAGGVKVFQRADPADHILIPLKSDTDKVVTVSVWEDTCNAVHVDEKLDQWFSDKLRRKCRLVFMPRSFKRMVDKQYASKGEITAFSDGFPFLLIGQPSLDDLNSRLTVPLTMDRFRPNIVFSGGYPYQEDGMKVFSIGSVMFKGVKRCARCVITTIDQKSADQQKEPLLTLAGYRQADNKIYFGQNLIHSGFGEIRVGDELIVHEQTKY